MNPDATLKSVVFPAPFGPMRLVTDPRRTPNSTSASAWRPPKDTETRSTERSSGACAATVTGGTRPRPEARRRDAPGAAQRLAGFVATGVRERDPAAASGASQGARHHIPPGGADRGWPGE